MSFTHLHVHSHYSLLDGLPKIPQLTSRAQELGYTALALTDHGSMYGAIEFYKNCLQRDIKPILGLEAYLAPRALQLKQAKVDSQNYHLTLLAKNETGYKNLMLLSTLGHLDGFYYKPRIDKKTLTQHAQGIICLSGCIKGELRQAIRRNNLDQARQIIHDYQSVFGADYFLEIQSLISHNESDKRQQAQELSAVAALGKELKVPLVATCDVHYLKPDEAQIQDVMLCIRTGNKLADSKRLNMTGWDLSLYPAEKIASQFSEYPEAIQNTQVIAQRCQLNLDLQSWHYPSFEAPGRQSASDYLVKLAKQGATQRYVKVTPTITKRLEYELDIINHKKYASYFLIYHDFMSWARQHNILTTSRGSASGSVVSYCLGITNIDPLKYRVPFERFLTKERPSPPDIDADIRDDSRDAVINYVKSKYGQDKVAQICTFGTMMARGSFRDVARALDKSFDWSDIYAKMIPFGSQGFPMTLAKALTVSPDLKKAYDTDPEVRRVYDIARQIEGCARHVSVHAAGVVVTPTALTDFLPLQIEPKGRNIITQYDMYSLDPNASSESVGVLKMDFLGLRNLSILGRCVELVKQIKKQDIDINQIPLDDQKTFKMLSGGLTFGVFQFASSGMTRYLKDLKPTQISDLMAMVALYRPGPMENIPEFIRRKNNPELIKYPDPRLKEVLEMSYGLLVYQDDVLYTVMILAGYEPSEADAFRKAVGKKIPSEMAAQKVKFFQGCLANGLTKTKAETIWKLIEPFAAYGFNKAHAASYGMLAYQTAYMKANFPAEYMTALMTCESAHLDKISEAVKESIKLNIQVLPPDVNESRAGFTWISDTSIRFGLNAVKNIGSDIIKTILRERQSRGKFETLEDFLTRLANSQLNKKSLEALIKAGALNSLGRRTQMLSNLDIILKYAKHVQRPNNGQASLFGAAELERPVLRLTASQQISKLEELNWEKELLGLYVSDHPFKNFKQILPAGLVELPNLVSCQPGQFVSTAGIVSQVKKIFTKKGDLMAFVRLEDLAGQTEVVVFPTIYAQTSDLWVENQPIIIQGKVNERNGELSLLVDRAQKMSDLQVNQNFLYENAPALPKTTHERVVQVRLSSRSDSRQMSALKKIFQQHPGPDQVQLLLSDNGQTQTIITRYKISLDEGVKENIEKLIGSDRIIILTN